MPEPMLYIYSSFYLTIIHSLGISVQEASRTMPESNCGETDNKRMGDIHT